MHAETRKQNEILDQIHNGLGNLLENAKVGRAMGRVGVCAGWTAQRWAACTCCPSATYVSLSPCPTIIHR